MKPHGPSVSHAALLTQTLLTSNISNTTNIYTRILQNIVIHFFQGISINEGLSV